ncbi:putative uncharacterized protein DDB_G0287457 [Metopolophium dirhodum]|uniref:putative uncharacterized protein DDB_G0287457 n=1 Tax=Metopolophium dirhodum TaxID=44670 RepID=UPI00298FEA27|nr:putative uncharacterized protein DDB_G0287457 [Metopolophium dirhodum]
MDVGTYIIIKGNDVLTQLDENDEECEELTEQFNVKPQVKDTVFNPNSKIEKLVLNKKKKLDNKYGNNTDNNNDNVSDGVNGNDNVGDNVNDNGNASSNVNDNGNACNYVNDNGNASNNVNDDYENSDIVSDSGSDSDPDIVNFIWNYENNLRTVPKSDRLTKSKSKNVTNFKSLTSNSVVENLQYHGADIYKNYMYYVDNDIYLLELEILVSKLLRSRASESYDIIEGEIEMLFLGYWKLETQDLKNYNEDSEQSSVEEDNSEKKNESKNNENECNEGKKCYDMSEDSDCVEDDFETLTRECDILCKDLGIQLFPDSKQAPTAIVKKINKRKQITDIANHKKKSKLNFLTNTTDVENITEKQNINTNNNSKDISNQYSELFGESIFSIEQKLRRELNLLENKLKSDTDLTTITSAVTFLDKLDCDYFPVFSLFIKILITLPISIATAERSFSSLRLLKTWLRTRMSEERKFDEKSEDQCNWYT